MTKLQKAINNEILHHMERGLSRPEIWKTLKSRDFNPGTVDSQFGKMIKSGVICRGEGYLNYHISDKPDGKGCTICEEGE